MIDGLEIREEQEISFSFRFRLAKWIVLTMDHQEIYDSQWDVLSFR